MTKFGTREDNRLFEFKIFSSPPEFRIPKPDPYEIDFCTPIHYNHT